MAKPFKPKSIQDQTIVITGASSGIGMASAKLAAKQGANVFMIARNGDALEKIAHEIREQGGECDFRVADVADEHALHEAAQQCVQRFGGFDTWVNNAGVTIYGLIEDVSIEDHRRLFETNFWGVVHGSRIASSRFRDHGGGTLINIGSTLSDRAIPLQGMYCATKHAVKGFTDALRMELEHDEAPVAVVLIKPAAIDTLYTEHAKSYLDEEPQNPAPLYAPRVVARCILHCAQHPRRDAFIGGAAKAFSFADQVAPRGTDHAMEWSMIEQQHSGKPAAPGRDDALYRPTTGARERSGKDRFVRKHSTYTQMEHHPLAATAVGLAALGAIIATGYAITASKPRHYAAKAGRAGAKMGGAVTDKANDIFRSDDNDRSAGSTRQPPRPVRHGDEGHLPTAAACATPAPPASVKP